MQVPVATPVTVPVVVTLHTVAVEVVYVTAKPELAVVGLAVVVPPTDKVVGEKVIGAMVWLSLATVMLCDTVGDAALYLASPAWLAAIVQVPPVIVVTVALLTLPVSVLAPTEQTPAVLEVKLICRPELAVALTTVVPPPALTVRGEKPFAVMVWLSLATVMLCDTVGDAALYVALPAWLAAIVQVPPVIVVTVAVLTPPLSVPAPTEQTLAVLEVKLTSNPELAVALTTVVPPALTVAGEKPFPVIV